MTATLQRCDGPMRLSLSLPLSLILSLSLFTHQLECAISTKPKWLSPFGCSSRSCSGDEQNKFTGRQHGRSVALHAEEKECAGSCARIDTAGGAGGHGGGLRLTARGAATGSATQSVETETASQVTELPGSAGRHSPYSSRPGHCQH